MSLPTDPRNDRRLPANRRPPALTSDPAARYVEPPGWLRRYLHGEGDLDRELSARYPSMPVMSILRVGAASQRYAQATLAAQDGAAALVVEADMSTRTLHCTFTLASMLGLRFALDGLSDLDGERWLEIMREGEGEPAFLWSAARWRADYLIGAAHRYYTNLFAFSPLHVEAAVRLTPEVTRRLLDWIEGCWFPQAVADDDKPAFSW